MSEPASYAEVPGRVREKVMTLHRVNERPDDAYAALRAELDNVPKPKRGLQWRRVDVLLDVHFRRYGRRVIRRLTRLRKAYDDRDQPERFDRLWENVQRLLGDLTVTTHGYSPRLTLRSTDQMWTRVREVIDDLGTAGYRAFVSSGTLLGLVRDHGVIANDDDVDLAVVLHSESSEAAAREWMDLRRRLRDSALLDADYDDLAHAHTKAATLDGLQIDLFPAWISSRRLYLFPYSFGDIAAEDVVPLKPLAVDDSTSVPSPAHPEVLLAANYGEDWRTPDPLFAFDWASAKERFSVFRDTVTETYASR